MGPAAGPESHTEEAADKVECALAYAAACAAGSRQAAGPYAFLSLFIVLHPNARRKRLHDFRQQASARSSTRPRGPCSKASRALHRPLALLCPRACGATRWRQRSMWTSCTNCTNVARGQSATGRPSWRPRCARVRVLDCSCSPHKHCTQRRRLKGCRREGSRAHPQ